MMKRSAGRVRTPFNRAPYAVALIGACVFLTGTPVQAGTAEHWEASLVAEADGYFRKALEHNDKLLELNRESFRGNLRAGWLHYSLAQYEDALEFYQRASSVSSGAITPLLGQMNCYWALHDRSKAIKQAKAVLSLDETNYTASLALAQLYYQEQEFGRATAVYRKLHRMYPEDLAVISGLAWSYLEQGWTKQATPLFEELVRWSPEYAYAQKGLEICK